MLLLRNKETLQNISFQTTIFNDRTSQIWKLNPDVFNDYDNFEIIWLFENESEIFHLIQLYKLLTEFYNIEPDVNAPFMPFSRQDKEITNYTTFSRKILEDILYNAGICRIDSFDIHSPSDIIYSQSPAHFFSSIYNHDFICYPDLGAYNRYNVEFTTRNLAISKAENLYCSKIRNQLTGEIEGLKVENPVDLTGKKVLIIDDICDGGRTFIEVAKALKKHNPTQIDLAVSHGIFSKGKQVLHDAGITNIYTTNSLLKNPEGYKIW